MNSEEHTPGELVPVRLTFPLPDKELYWNRRTHHMKLARLKKESRRLGWVVAEKHFRTLALPEEGVLWKGYRIEPHYPDNRRRDDDSLIHACKGLLDGIFIDFLHIDDSKVRLYGCEPTVDKGCKPFMYIDLYYQEL